MQGVRRGVLLFALVFFFGCASPRADGPALWRVRDQDSEIYLLGTVHILPPELQWRTARIDTAFRRSDTIWFETPTDETASREIAALVARTGRNPAGVTLSSLLEPADRERLSRVAKKLGLDQAVLEPARPWLASLQLSLAELQREGNSAESGVEHILEEEARLQRKRTAYFETAEDQISIFSSLAPADEMAFLVSTIRQIDEDAEDPNEMASLWANGRVEELGAKVRELAKEAGPVVEDALLTRRNKRFAKAIEHDMEGAGIAFVAVGAAHMSGPEGVPALLRADGYKVDGPGAFSLEPAPAR